MAKKLTLKAKCEILEKLTQPGHSQRSVAKGTGVSRKTIQNILKQREQLENCSKADSVLKSSAMILFPRSISLVLEWTCHGVLWLMCNFAWLFYLWWTSVQFRGNLAQPSGATWSIKRWLSGPDLALFPDPWTRALCFLFSILLDLSVVGMLKTQVRRPRPAEHRGEDMRITVAADQWSFPSGHASRSVLALWLIPTMFPISTWQLRMIVCWVLAICYSRYSMKRHYLSDILAGVLLGFLEYQFVTSIHWPTILQTLLFPS